MYYWTLCKEQNCIRPSYFDWRTPYLLVLKYPKQKQKYVQKLLKEKPCIALIEEVGDRAYMLDSLIPVQIRSRAEGDEIVVEVEVSF